MWSYGATKRAGVDPPETEGFLLSASTIDPATRQAFLETHYLVDGATPLNLQVGIASASLAARDEAQHVGSCVFITACNPWCQSLDAAANAQRQAILAAELQQRGLAFVEGMGQHPSGDWPGEASFLVWDLSLEAAKALGNKHQQNAIIWCGDDAVPQLITLQ